MKSTMQLHRIVEASGTLFAELWAVQLAFESRKTQGRIRRNPNLALGAKASRSDPLDVGFHEICRVSVLRQ